MFGKDMHTLAKEVLILNADSPPFWYVHGPWITELDYTVVYESLFSLL